MSAPSHTGNELGRYGLGSTAAPCSCAAGKVGGAGFTKVGDLGTTAGVGVGDAERCSTIFSDFLAALIAYENGLACQKKLLLKVLYLGTA